MVPGAWRTARKPWRCIGADPIRKWEAKRYCEHGWSAWSTKSEADALAHIERRRGDACHGGKVPTDERWEVVPIANPNYQPGCLVDIPVGARYFEYMGESMAWESGSRYCAVCAGAVWNEHDPQALTQPQGA